MLDGCSLAHFDFPGSLRLGYEQSCVALLVPPEPPAQRVAPPARCLPGDAAPARIPWSTG